MQNLSILALLFLMASCKQAALPTDAATFGNDLSLTSGAAVQVKPGQNSSGAAVTVQVVKITDSRCPTGVDCMWAGKAEVLLKLTAKSKAERTVNLCLGQCETAFKETDTTAVAIDGDTYNLTLLQVNPYPTNQNATQPKTAVVKVEAL